MSNMKMYYDEKEDSVTIVLDDKIIDYQDSVNSSEYLNGWIVGVEIKTVDDLVLVEPKAVLEELAYMMEDFLLFSTSEEILTYINFTEVLKVSGRLFYDKDFENEV